MLKQTPLPFIQRTVLESLIIDGRTRVNRARHHNTTPASWLYHSHVERVSCAALVIDWNVCTRNIDDDEQMTRSDQKHSSICRPENHI